MGDKLAGCTGKVLACLGQGFEVPELVWASRAACEHPQAIREHNQVSWAQGAVGEKRRNRIGNFSDRLWFYRILDFYLLHNDGLRVWPSFAPRRLNPRIRLIPEGLG